MSFEFGGAENSDARGLEPTNLTDYSASGVEAQYPDAAGISAEDPAEGFEPLSEEPDLEDTSASDVTDVPNDPPDIVDTRQTDHPEPEPVNLKQMFEEQLSETELSHMALMPSGEDETGELTLSNEVIVRYYPAEHHKIGQEPIEIADVAEAEEIIQASTEQFDQLRELGIAVPHVASQAQETADGKITIASVAGRVDGARFNGWADLADQPASATLAKGLISFYGNALDAQAKWVLGDLARPWQYSTEGEQPTLIDTDPLMVRLDTPAGRTHLMSELEYLEQWAGMLNHPEAAQMRAEVGALYDRVEDMHLAAQPEAAPPQPYKVVEIGAGGAPLLLSPTAPDVERLYREGGIYIAVDANPAALASGREAISDWFVNVHKAPEATVDTEFVVADIAPGNELPEALQADSVDRVVIANVFTLPAVARQPDVCAEIARTAQHIVRKDPPGEVVVIGFYSPSVYPKERLTELMESAGLEHVGPDDMAEYFPPDQRDLTFINPASYVERYRPRQSEASPEQEE